MKRATPCLVLAALAVWGGSALGPSLSAPKPLLALLASALLLMLAGRGRAPVACSSVALFAAGAAASVHAPETDIDRARAGLHEAVLHDLRRTPYGLALQMRGFAAPLYVSRHGDARYDKLDPRIEPGAMVRFQLAHDSGSLRIGAASLIEFVHEPRGWSALRTFPERTRARFQERARLRLRVERSETDRLAFALVTGDLSLLGDETRRVLRESGTAHLAVVSGLHVAVLAIVAGIAATPRLGSHHPARRAAELVAALGATCCLPAQSPVLRATAALGVSRAGALIGRGVPPASALAMAVIGLLALDPGLARDLSFTLTVAATAAILAAIEGGATWTRLALALAPWLATWPILATAFDRVSPWGPVATALATPAALPALCAGWVAVLWPAESRIVLWSRAVAHGGSWALLEVSHEVAAWPLSGAIAAPAGLVWIVLHLVALTFALMGAPALRTVARVGVLMTWAWVLRPVAPEWRGPLEIVDVGQGQAVLVGDEHGAILVDAGDDRSREGTRALLAHLRATRRTRLDALAITHWDRDHAGGARDVLGACRPKRLYVTEGVLHEPDARSLLRAASRRGVVVSVLEAGNTLRIGAADLEVFWPKPASRRSDNASSLVLRVDAGGLSAWLPGDLGIPEENSSIAAHDAGAVDVLVPGHHGARESTHGRLLAALDPDLAIASCGRNNRHGHPHRDTMTRMERHGVVALQTARLGSIAVRQQSGRRVIEARGPVPATGAINR